MNKLTYKQEAFCYEYAACGSKTLAYQKVYKVESKSTACKGGIHIMKKKEAQDKVEYYKDVLRKSMKEEIKKKFNMTVDDTMIAIQEVSENAEKPSDKLKGYELIGRHLGAFVDKKDVTVSGGVEVVRIERPDNGRLVNRENDDG